MKRILLICHKIGCDPEKKQKNKSIQIEKDSATQFFAIAIVSDEKDPKFTINKWLFIPLKYDNYCILQYTSHLLIK